MKKIVKIKQADQSDCGAACIASIAAHFNLLIPISRIRQFASTDKKGTNVLGLIDAANKIGFLAKGAKGQLESLTKVPLPTIAQVRVKNDLLHFVVIYKVQRNTILIMDPIDGEQHKLLIPDFERKWTSILILMLPDEGFKTGNLKHSKILRFWELIKPHWVNMLQAIIGAIIYSLLGLSASIYIQKLLDIVIPEGNARLLNLLSMLMILILCMQLFIGVFKSILGLKTGQQIDAKLILGYYKHVLKLPQTFFDSMRVGEIISRINDAVKIRLFINDVAINIIVNALIIFFSIGLMLLFYSKLALIIIAILPIYILIFWISNHINKKWQRTLMENNADLEANLVESLRASGTIKRFGIEAYDNLKTESRFVALLKSIYASTILSIRIGTSFELTTRIFTIIILWVGSYFVISRELSAGELLSFYSLIGYFTGPAASLISANKNIQEALIAADRLFEIIDLESENSNDNCIQLTSDLVGDINFQNVSFRYGSRTKVFENLCITIKKGEITAVIGESGSGKSTLLSLLQNLYPLNQGSISIGNINLQNISNKSLREKVAVVPQQIDLFGGTIIENIALGDFEPDINRLLNISQKLGIHEFVEKMPFNYNTILHEQGTNLSGGQKQRIAIARAFYRNPDILILDEATSSLDTLSEHLVQEALKTFKENGKTIILITHRLTSIKNADTIIFLKNGTLVEQGSYTELIENKNSFLNSFFRTN